MSVLVYLGNLAIKSGEKILIKWVYSDKTTIKILSTINESVWAWQKRWTSTPRSKLARKAT